MYPIKYPVEGFFWRLHDGRGNAEIEIRDADRRTIFFMRIKGRAVDESTRLKDELVPLVVKLLNLNEGLDNPSGVLHKVPFLEAVGVGNGDPKTHEWKPDQVLPEPTPEAIEETKPKRGRGRPKKT